LIVLLLLDPFRTNLLYKQDLVQVVELCGHEFFGRYRTEVLASGSKDRPVQAENRCMYDALVNAHDAGMVDHTCTPSSATAFARNLVRSSWEERIHRAEWVLYGQMCADDNNHRKYQGVSDRPPSSEKRNQNAMWYQEMIEMRRDFNIWRRKVKNIYHAFVAEEIEPRVEPELRAAAQLALDRERRSWARLMDKLATMEATISNHMEEFSQRAALEESFAAGRQARSAGQLTKIATVIVPCTFVASIFSMGGSFAAGEDLFYVYWTISVPMTVALLAWVVHKEVLEWWKNTEKNSWVDRKKAALQERMLGKRAESRDVEKGEGGAVREEKKER
jgi:Mg2+ and Co2+ transporter CorA